MNKEKWQNLKVFKRTSKTYKLIFTTNGKPEDITGWTVYFTVKPQQNDAETLSVIKKDIVNHTDAVNGKTEIQLSPDDTDLITRPYYYDIVVKDDIGNINVIAYGRFTVDSHATERA